MPRNKRTARELADQENLQYLRLQGRIILNRVMNEVEDIYGKEFDAWDHKGKIYRIEDARADLYKFLKQGIMAECAAIEGSVSTDEG